LSDEASYPQNHSPACLSLWLKLAYSAFVLVLIPVYWVEYGPVNFLWLCDIALLVTYVALWLKNRLLISMMAVGLLLPELVWNADFFSHLFAGHDMFGFDATAYMFSPDIPLYVRSLSLFHVFLPIVLVHALLRLGYDPRAGLAQTLLAWIVMPVSYLVSGPDRNINWVYGLTEIPQTWLPGGFYVLAVMLVYFLLVIWPTHLVLKYLLKYRSTGLQARP
jgi:hypothetical protein